MKVNTVLVRLFLGGWFLATVAHQFTSLRKYTSAITLQGLTLPIWTFFAPFPGSQDAELLFRTFDESRTAARWEHIAIYQPRRLSHVVVHFNRRLEKVVFDAVSEIRVLLHDAEDKSAIVASPAYIILLSVVLAQARIPSGAREVQFMLIQSGGYDEARGSVNPVFVSDRHPIANGR